MMAEDRRVPAPETKRNPKLLAAGRAMRSWNRGRRLLREFALGAILTIVPLLLSVMAIFSLVVAQQRSSALDALARRAKATAEEVDRIWAGHTTMLMGLAGSPALARGDLEGGFLRRHLRAEPGRTDLQRLEVRAPALPGGDRQLGRQQATRAGQGGGHLDLGL